MKTIEEMLQNLGRANVTEFALVSQRLPCVKVNGAFKPVDDYAPTTEEILEMLVAAGGSWYIASLGPAATQWALNVEGIGTVGVQAIMREGNVQARFMVTQRDPFAVPAVAPPLAPAPPPTSKIATRPQAGGAPPPPSRVAGAPALRQNPPFPPAPPSSAVALIANEPFIDDDPRSTLGQQAPTTRDPRARATPPRAPFPAPPPLVAMEPGTEEPGIEERDAADLFEFSPSPPRAPLPAPGPPEALVPPDWKATQISAPVARQQPQQAARPEPRAADNSQAAMAEMDSLVLRLAEELDVGPRRVRVVIELVLETIDRTGLPPREALEALAAAEKAAKKK